MPLCQVRLVLEMLHVEPWLRFPLALQFTSSGHSALRSGAPPPPPHVAVRVAPVAVRRSRARLPVCCWPGGQAVHWMRTAPPCRVYVCASPLQSVHIWPAVLA